MANRLDYRTTAGRTVGETLLAPLLARGAAFRVVDAGARNGMFELPASYAAAADFVGFEPNEDEYRKLVDGTTDAARYGLHSPRWKSEAFHPYALWDREESRPFFITVGVGASTLMGAVNEDVAGRMYLYYPDGRGVKRYYDHAVEVKRTTEVKCCRLDSLLDADRPVDYLKLDVEGAELAILEGSEKLFAAQRVLFVKTEFVMVPYYDQHPLFGHQQAFLDKAGLRFLGFDLGHMKYTREQTKIAAAADRRLIYAGDAFFALDPDRNALPPEDLHRIGIMSLIHGFASFGMSVIRDAGLLSATELDAVETALARIPLRSRARYFCERLPYYVGTQLAIARQRLSRLRGKRAA